MSGDKQKPGRERKDLAGTRFRAERMTVDKFALGSQVRVSAARNWDSAVTADPPCTSSGVRGCCVLGGIVVKSVAFHQLLAGWEIDNY